MADASIYGLIRPQEPVRFQSPEEVQMRQMKIQELMGNRELQGLQLQQARQGMEDERATRDFYRNLQPGTDPRTRIDELRRVNPRAASQLEKESRERDKGEAELQRIDRENFIAFADNARKRLATIRDPGAWQAYRDEQIQLAGMFKTPEIRAQALRAAQSMPAQFDPNYIRDSLVKAEQLFTPNMQERTDGKLKWMEDTNPFTNPAILNSQPVHMQATPGERLTDERTRSEGAANRGVTLRGQNLTDTRARDLAQATRDAAATGRIPPGYRTKADGTLEAIPGGPADEKEEKKQAEIKKTVDMYVAARDGLLSGLESSATGPMSGRIPAMTSAQQIAEGGVSAMAPVLKQIFRVAGEGTFTDKDQELLLRMVPTRADNPEARAEKIANIDRIVAAKLGAAVPTRTSSKGTISNAPVRISGDDGYNALPKGALYIGPDGVTRQK